MALTRMAPAMKLLTGNHQTSVWSLESRVWSPRSRRAFTVTEFLVVLGVVSLIVSLGVPAFLAYTKHVRLNTTTREIVGVLSLARSSAISARAAHTVVFDPEARTLVMEAEASDQEPQVARLHPSLTLEIRRPPDGEPLQGQTRLVFQPSGALEGRSAALTVSNSTRSQTVLVTGVTGAISVQ